MDKYHVPEINLIYCSVAYCWNSILFLYTKNELFTLF